MAIALDRITRTMLDMCDDSRSLRTVVVALVAAALFAGCSHAQQPRRVATAEVPLAAAPPGSVTPQTTLGGRIVPFQNVQVTSTLVEPADTVTVSEGNRVSK